MDRKKRYAIIDSAKKGGENGRKSQIRYQQMATGRSCLRENFPSNVNQKRAICCC
jgi:hypothetical protein